MDTSLKTCFKCGQSKERSEFYKHARMGDGLLGKCKECAKKDVRERYDSPEGRVKVTEYEQKRARTEHRRKKKVEYGRKHKTNNPVKNKARQIVANAIRSGKIHKQPCEICGNPKSQAHHEDYSKPLDVQWLCFKHHREIGHGQTVIIEEW